MKETFSILNALFQNAQKVLTHLRKFQKPKLLKRDKTNASENSMFAKNDFLSNVVYKKNAVEKYKITNL